MKIGVFDSGIGGLSVANAIEKALPEHQVVFKNDSEHMPYGTKSPEQLLELVSPIFTRLIAEGCQVIVVACNSVSTTIIERLREDFDLPIIGVEPLIKLAAELTQTNIIAVCATPTTLASGRYHVLKNSYAAELTVLEPDCSDWANMIQRQQVEEQKVRATIEQLLKANADVIVLGCTHYHWIEEEINNIVGNSATIIQPEPLIIEELKLVIARLRSGKL